MAAATKSPGQILRHAFVSSGGEPCPDHDAFSLQFTQLERALQESGTAASECLSTLGRIDPGNREDWYRVWKSEAETSRTRADSAFAKKNFRTAQRNWLQASAYYRSAGAFLAADDKRKSQLSFQINACSRRYLEAMKPAGEVVNICYDRGRFIEGYFVRAPNAAPQSPVVVCFGGREETKDELLEKMIRFSLARDLSLIIIDLPRQGTVPKIKFPQHYVPISISACVDYLLTRSDVDQGRIAVFGNNLGAVDASRAASLDPRFAAAVCDGGIWEENSRSILFNWAARRSAGAPLQAPGRDVLQYGLARSLRCPFLVTSGEFEFLEMQDAKRLHDRCGEFGGRMDLRFFSAEDSGAPRRTFIFDWLATKLQASFQ